MHSFKIAAGQNPLIALGELEDIVAKMRAIGLVVDAQNALHLVPRRSAR